MIAPLFAYVAFGPDGLLFSTIERNEVTATI